MPSTLDIALLIRLPHIPRLSIEISSIGLVAAGLLHFGFVALRHGFDMSEAFAERVAETVHQSVTTYPLT